MRNIFALVLAALLNQPNLSSVAIAAEDREDRLISHARYCLLNDIMLSSVSPGTYQSLVSCRGSELGLAFIGERSSRRADAELAKLRRYVLDGALGESYTCYVLSKGKRMLPLLDALDFSEQRKICEAEVGQRIRELGIVPNKLNVDTICSTQSSAQNWIQDISVAAKAGRKCSEQDW